MIDESGSEAGETSWWAVDLAGYLLTRLEPLGTPIIPSSLSEEQLEQWLRTTELPWAPGSPHPTENVPWQLVRGCSTEAELVDLALTEAASAFRHCQSGGHGSDDPRMSAARRFLPLSTLMAYGFEPGHPESSDLSELADGHVHQGAALPFEVTLRWAALNTTAMSEPSLEPGFTDSGGGEFNPQPLVLLLRHLLLHPGQVSLDYMLRARDAATGSEDSWRYFNAMAREENAVPDPEPLGLEAIATEKRLAITDTQVVAAERIARLRVESIILSGVTQSQAGLDIFVDRFERFARLRRGRVNKSSYFRNAIQETIVRSEKRLTRLELRVGERIASSDPSVRAIEDLYRDALTAYGDVLGEQQRIAVSFPFGLVKSPRTRAEHSEHWRFNPSGLFRWTESLLDLLKRVDGLSHFVDGIDVSGLETEEPNWLFAPAFQRFSTESARFSPRPTCRFHAGEWQWSPLHGLRRISEFLDFRMDAQTPVRIGHALALRSRDWTRLADQPLSEVLDDLVWSRQQLLIVTCPPPLLRKIERAIHDLAPVTLTDWRSLGASFDDLCAAYAARTELDSLRRISFLETSANGEISFPDSPPTPSDSILDRLLVAHLAVGGTSDLLLGQAVERVNTQHTYSLENLRATLEEAYELLATEIAGDVVCRGAIVEVCPTSNVFVGGVSGYSAHPMQHFIESGIPVTVNTDDPSILHVWMQDELANASGPMGVPDIQVEAARERALALVAPGVSIDDLPALATRVATVVGGLS